MSSLTHDLFHKKRHKAFPNLKDQDYQGYPKPLAMPASQNNCNNSWQEIECANRWKRVLFIHSVRVTQPYAHANGPWSHDAHVMEMSMCDQGWAQVTLATRVGRFRKMWCLLESRLSHLPLLDSMYNEQLTFCCLFCSFQAFIWQECLMRQRNKCLPAAFAMSHSLNWC